MTPRAPEAQICVAKISNKYVRVQDSDCRPGGRPGDWWFLDRDDHGDTGDYTAIGARVDDDYHQTPR